MIDSIIYYWSNTKLIAVQTFKNNKNIFENIYFYPNGNIRKYLFVSAKSPNFFYERDYDSSGRFVDNNGTIFFQGMLSGINNQTLEVKLNTNLSIHIYHPNPPDCKVLLYIKDASGNKIFTFKRSNYINFLDNMYIDCNEIDNNKMWNEVDVWMAIIEKSGDTTFYNKPVYYKVIK